MKITSFLKSALPSPTELFKKVMNPVQQWVQSSFGRVKPSQSEQLSKLENKVKVTADYGKIHTELNQVFGQKSAGATSSTLYASLVDNVGGKMLEIGKSGEFGNPLDEVRDGVNKVVNKAVDAGTKAAAGVAKATLQKISQTAKDVGNDIKKGAMAVVNKVVDFGTEVGRGILNGTKQLATGLADSGAKTATELAEGVVGFGKHLIQGEPTAALRSMWRGVDKGILQLPTRLGNTLVGSVKTAADGLWSAMGVVGKPFQWASDFILNSTQTIFETGGGMARDILNAVPEVVINTVGDVEKTARQLFKGDFFDSAKTLFAMPSHALGRMIGGVSDVVIRGFYGMGSLASNAITLEKNVTSKVLDAQMIHDLKNAYGKAVDLSAVRINLGGIGPVGAPKTIGNTIYVPQVWSGYNVFDPSSGKITPSGRKLIMHEMSHVWQNQNGGGDYIHQSLWSQARAFFGSGSRNNAYDWKAASASGLSFNELNPEQQASAVETATWLLSKKIPLNSGNNISYTDPQSNSNKVLTVAQQNFLQGVLQLVQDGEGAP